MVAIPAARVTYTSEVATGVGSVLKTFAAEETPPPLVRLTLQPGDLALKYDGGQRIRENMWGGGVPKEGLPIFQASASHALAAVGPDSEGDLIFLMSRNDE